jgi:hypothetical protein
MAGGTPANPATMVPVLDWREEPMADERLLTMDEFLVKLIVTVMHDGRPMTAAEIAKVASKSSARRVDRRSVEAMLRSAAGEVVILPGVSPCRIIPQRRRRLLQRATRWRLVVVPASPPNTSGSPVPAWPYPPTLSGTAAVPLTFGEDEPPTNAIGKLA